MKKFLSPALIIIAGEAIFILPFLIPRLLRPSMLQAWNFTNQDIGLAFSAYGFTALISYFFGGILADRYSARKLIATSLTVTAAGGLSFLFQPTPLSFILTYAFFGVSTILFMWGAMLKYTHEEGGEAHRASAMGILDSGRGITAAITSTLIVALLQVLKFESQSLTYVYIAVSSALILLAVLIWFGVSDHTSKETERQKWSLQKMLQLANNPEAWCLALVVLCAYCGYKSIDNYSTYLVDILGYSQSESARMTTVFFWARPVGALLTGFMADHYARNFKGARFLFICGLFAVAGLGYVAIILNHRQVIWLTLIMLTTSALMVYGMRAIYFAVLGDLKIPHALVGTMIGLVSVIGFLPDFFYGALTGTIIDRHPGLPGHQLSLAITAAFMITGLFSSYFLYRRSKS